MIRKILAGLVVLVAASGVFGVLVVRGTFGMDQWVVRQVVTIFETYIHPTIDFERFNFSRPKTVELLGATLTAEDGTRVIEARRLLVQLAKRPKRGEPIVMERIEIEGARVLMDAYLSEDDELNLRGFVPFVKTQNVQNQSEVAENVRLSEVLQIRKLMIRDSSIEYDPVLDLPNMVIDGLELDMDVQPDNADNGPGWYALGFKIDRSPLLDIDFQGEINLDTLEAHIEAFTLDVVMGEEAYTSLPPRMQELARNHEIRGRTHIVTKGFTDADDPSKSAFTTSIRIEDGNFATGDLRFPLEELVLDVEVHDGLVLLDRADAKLLSGELHLPTGMFEIGPDRDEMLLEWEIRGIDLQRLLRERAPEGEPPFVAGIFSSFGQVGADPRDIMDTIEGSGEIHVVDGRLVNSPSVQALSRAMNIVGRVTGTTYSDSADVVFTAGPDGIDMSTFKVATTALAAEGHGTLTWGWVIDVLFSGGPIKSLGNKLGLVGQGINNVAGRIVKYRVYGPLDEELSVEVKPLGF